MRRAGADPEGLEDDTQIVVFRGRSEPMAARASFRVIRNFKARGTHE
jgi:hypothetical protein